MKQWKKVVATNGKYTDANGQEKNRYVTVGKAFVRDDKSVSIKVDAMPVGPEFSGWLNLYDLDDEQPRKAAPAAAPAMAPVEDEALPF